ncbi:hypothetical protein BJY04DRAFT_213707 [Aspergillus karnatakaensis]|uniref:uncharacterized protein n=1 Tax=Aspergillus karnatakaensis TaxID=1810916 RepID=UPI003CCE16D1
MASSKQCPPEIWDLVLDQLAPSEYRTLCLVSKGFRAIAEPLLYSKIEWIWKHVHAPVIQYHYPPIVQLLRTLLARQELADCITTMHLAGYISSHNPCSFETPRFQIPEIELDGAISFVQKANPPYGERWIQGIREGSMGALVELLLTLLPNLRVLYLTRNSLGRRLSLWPISDPPVASNLRALHLTHIRQKGLGELLCGTPNLTALEWSWFYHLNWSTELMTWTVELDQLTHALSPIRSTLTNLTLKADAIGGPFDPGVKLKGSMSGIVEFDRIKRLQAPLALLVWFPKNTATRLRGLIPRNLELLVLTDELRYQNIDGHDHDCPQWEWDDYAILDLVRTWLEDDAGVPPHLRQIALMFREIEHDEGEWSLGMQDRLRELGDRAGIQAKLTDMDPESNL